MWSLGCAGHPARGRGPRWPGRPVLSLPHPEGTSLPPWTSQERAPQVLCLGRCWQFGLNGGNELPHSPEEPSQMPPHISVRSRGRVAGRTELVSQRNGAWGKGAAL